MSERYAVRYIQARKFARGRKLGGRPVGVRSVILHSTDGHKEGDIETLTGPRVSVHWYVPADVRPGDPDHPIYHFVQEADTAYHAGSVMDASLQSNAVTIGIEQEHMDGDAPWPDNIVRATAWLIVQIRRRHHGHLPVLGHAAIAKPKGRKVDPQAYPWPLLSAYVAEEARA